MTEAVPKERFVYQCALRWSDLDAFGHVNNARYLTLLEEARAALLFLGAAADGVEAFSAGVVIARHEIDYLRPVGYVVRERGQQVPTVRVELWVTDLRPSRFTIGYELFDGETLACRARSVLVPFDLDRQRPRRLTEAEMTFLMPYTVPSADSGSGE
ncbi:MAG TPA: thioesterase family protein [Micromonosporaceae bacterium]